MNDSAQTPQERQQQEQITKLVLEEVISQRNTLMNEIASLTVQLKVAQMRIKTLEKELKKTESSTGSGEGD